MTATAADLFLLEYGHVLLELATNARAQADGVNADQFALGRSVGLYEAVSLLTQQAIAFQLSLPAVGLPEGFDADRDLQ